MFNRSLRFLWVRNLRALPLLQAHPNLVVRKVYTADPLSVAIVEESPNRSPQDVANSSTPSLHSSFTYERLQGDAVLLALQIARSGSQGGLMRQGGKEETQA